MLLLAFCLENFRFSVGILCACAKVKKSQKKIYRKNIVILTRKSNNRQKNIQQEEPLFLVLVSENPTQKKDVKKILTNKI